MINPAIFYLIDVIDGLGAIFAIVGGLSTTAALVCGGMLIGEQRFDDEDEEKCVRLFKIFSIVGVIGIILAIVIPSKQAMVEMLVAKYATSENAKMLVDYIVETWTRLKR